MDKSRLFLLLILSALLIFVGLAARQPGVLLLAAPLIVYLGAAVALAPQRVHLSAGRRLLVTLPGGGLQGPPPVEASERVIPADSAVTVRVRVENVGLGLSEVVMADEDWRRGVSLGSGASCEWEYTFTPPRGRYHFHDLRILAGDPFGLLATPLSVAAPTDGQAKASLLVLPRVISLKRIPIRPPQLRGFAGPVAARAPGSGADFFGVRAYHAGDSPRHLNWRVSSKYERNWFTNQYEGERFADIGLILDARQSRNLRAPTGDLFEHTVLAAASLGRAFLRDGHRVSLLVYGYNMARVPPGSGHVHGERLMRVLAAAHPLHNYALDDLNYLPVRLFPAHSQIVFVSPLAEEDFEPLVRYRALGYAVLVLSPNPVAYEAREIMGMGRDLVQPGDHNLALRMAYIERRLLIRRLARYGVWVIDWRVERPLLEALRRGQAPLRSAQHMLRY